MAGISRRFFIQGTAGAAAALAGRQLFGKEKTGLVGVPVADLRKRASDESSLETQALMGTPVRIFGSEGDYHYVEALPQNYPGHVLQDEIVETPEALDYLVNRPLGMVSVRKVPLLSEPDSESDVVDTLHTSTILPVTERIGDDFFEVELPDGSKGYIERWMFYFNNHEAVHKRSKEQILQTANTAVDRYQDTPYLWGGITPDGLDCSGFMMWLFRYNGQDIPRDSWQQFARTTGVVYDRDRRPPEDESLITRIQDLEPVDLVFFSKSKNPGAITHVGLMGDDGRMLHAAVGTQRNKGRALDRSTLTNDPLWGNYFKDHFIGGRRYLKE